MGDSYHFKSSTVPAVSSSLDAHTILRQRQVAMRQRLALLGADNYDLHLPETYTLPLVISPTETIRGVLYGRYTLSGEHETVLGRGVLVATDRRIVFLDKKPLYVRLDDISYDRVGSITFERVLFMSNVVLHTRMGDFHFRTFNHKAAHQFVSAIETELFNKKVRSV